MICLYRSFADISIHSLRMEGDNTVCRNGNWTRYFNPLPPHGGRLSDGGIAGASKIFQSTPSAWRETLPSFVPVVMLSHFNPLPPHGGRPGFFDLLYRRYAFQSTPSAWRETHSCSPRCHRHWNFNPLPPHGGRRFQCIADVRQCNISIHSLRMEGDPKDHGDHRGDDISIHSLRMEGDHIISSFNCHCLNFNPLPPHGGRLQLQQI